MPSLNARYRISSRPHSNALVAALLVASCATPTLPGYSGPSDGLGMIGSNAYVGQQRIYRIETINGFDPPAPGGVRIKVPPGEYRVHYKWGYWGKAMNYDAHTVVKVEAGKCYQPWFVERRLPAERYSEGTMLCWDRFNSNVDGTYSPQRVCEPLTSVRYPVQESLVMNEYPKEHELCKGFE